MIGSLKDFFDYNKEQKLISFLTKNKLLPNPKILIDQLSYEILFKDYNLMVKLKSLNVDFLLLENLKNNLDDLIYDKLIYFVH